MLFISLPSCSSSHRFYCSKKVNSYRNLYTQKDACSLIPCHTTHHISKSWCYKEEQHLLRSRRHNSSPKKMHMQHVERIPSTQLSRVKLKLKLVKLVILFCCNLDWIMAGIAGIGRCIESIYLAGFALLLIRWWVFVSTTKIFASDIYISYYITFYDRSVAYVCVLFFIMFIICNWNRWACARA